MSKLGRLARQVLWDNPHQRWFLAAMVWINGIGSLVGYLWYAEQLPRTPYQYWVFVPDSPLASTLMTIALWSLWRGYRWHFFNLVAFTAVIKYGIWAVVLISDFWLRGGPVTPMEMMLWLSHLGMAVEGVIFLRHLPVVFPHLAGITAWLFLNDYMDYHHGLHPNLFRPDQRGIALATALIMSVVLTVAVWARYRQTSLVWHPLPDMKPRRAE